MENFSWKTLKNICILIFIVCLGCNHKALVIEPIGDGVYPAGGYFWREEDGVEIRPCVSEYRYYTIANYKHIPYDSLYSIVHTYINSKQLYEEYIENVKRNHKCSFAVFFYKKSLFTNYEKYLPDAIRSEYGHFDKYYHKQVVEVFEYSHNGYYFFETVLFNRKKILWEKKDTIWVRQRHDRVK